MLTLVDEFSSEISAYEAIPLAYREHLEHVWPRWVKTGIEGDPYREVYNYDMIQSYEDSLFPSLYADVLNSLLHNFVVPLWHRWNPDENVVGPEFKYSCEFVDDGYVVGVHIIGEGPVSFVGKGLTKLAASFDLFRVLSLEYYEEFMPGLQDLNFAIENDCFVDDKDRSAVTVNGLSQLLGQFLGPYLNEAAYKAVNMNKRAPEVHLGQIELREGIFELYWANQAEEDLIDEMSNFRHSINIYEMGNIEPVGRTYFSGEDPNADGDLYVGPVRGKFDSYPMDWVKIGDVLEEPLSMDNSFSFPLGTIKEDE